IYRPCSTWSVGTANATSLPSRRAEPPPPLQAIARRATAVPSQPVSAAAHTCVLIVDDDPDICLLFSTALSARGYEVDTASNGDEALTALASGPLPMAIVADLHMPVMDGWKFLSAL